MKITVNQMDPLLRPIYHVLSGLEDSDNSYILRLQFEHEFTYGILIVPESELIFDDCFLIECFDDNYQGINLTDLVSFDLTTASDEIEE